MNLSEDQLNTLDSPVRHRLVELIAQGGASAAELADAIGESTAFVLYHLNCLLRANLIRAERKRTHRHRAERVFELCADRLLLSGSEDRQERAESLYAHGRLSLRAARRELEEASQGPEIEDVSFVRWRFGVSPEGLQQLRSALKELARIVQEHPGEEAFTLTCAMVPVPKKREWSGQRDLNPRPLAPQASALPNCAMPRRGSRKSVPETARDFNRNHGV